MDVIEEIYMNELIMLYYFYAYAYVYAILFRRPPLPDDIGVRYSMFDPAFDKGHRARFIENGVVITIIETLNQSFRINENKLLIFGVHILADAPATAHEGSLGCEDAVRRALRAVLQESPTVGFRPAVQASAADARPLSSHNFGGPVAAQDAQFPSPMWGDEGDPRGLGDDYGPTD